MAALARRREKKRRIAVAIGDANGIGPEIAVQAAAQLSGGAIEPILVGDAFVIRAYLERHASEATDRAGSPPPRGSVSLQGPHR